MVFHRSIQAQIDVRKRVSRQWAYHCQVGRLGLLLQEPQELGICEGYSYWRGLG